MRLARLRSVRRPLHSLAVVLVLLVAVGCDADPAATDLPTAVGGRVVADGFILEVRLPSAAYAPEDAIPLGATVTWTGEPGRGRIWGSGMGPVSYFFTEVGGAKRVMGGAMTADCTMKEFAAGVPTAVPLRKSGAWTDKDPNGPFYQAWFKDPLLHLPTGRWHVSVTLGGYLAQCALDAKAIEAVIGPIEIIVR
jgi:hypothetical protein